MTSKLRKRYGTGFMICRHDGRRKEVRAIIFVHEMVFYEAKMIGLKAATIDVNSGRYRIDPDTIADPVAVMDKKSCSLSPVYHQARQLLLMIADELKKANLDFEINTPLETQGDECGFPSRK